MQPKAWKRGKTFAPKAKLRNKDILWGFASRGSSNSSKKAYAKEINNVASMLPPTKKNPIIFISKDAVRIQYPHNDPVVTI